MATRRALLDLLERAKQLLREGKMPVNTTYYRGDPGCTTFTGAELDELAATARALAADRARARANSTRRSTKTTTSTPAFRYNA